MRPMTSNGLCWKDTAQPHVQGRVFTRTLAPPCAPRIHNWCESTELLQLAGTSVISAWPAWRHWGRNQALKALNRLSNTIRIPKSKIRWRGIESPTAQRAPTVAPAEIETQTQTTANSIGLRGRHLSKMSLGNTGGASHLSADRQWNWLERQMTMTILPAAVHLSWISSNTPI